MKHEKAAVAFAILIAIAPATTQDEIEKIFDTVAEESSMP
jgi:hypothetical protein